MPENNGYPALWAQRDKRVAQGQRQTGISVGLTSKSEQAKAGTDAPCFGYLTNAMARPENGAIDLGNLEQPAVSAGLAFMLGKPLDDKNASIADAQDAIEFVIPALHVVDLAVATIGNNSGSVYYITGGRPLGADALDLRTLGVVAEKNGVIAAMGAGAQILDHPLNAIVAAARQLAANRETLAAGSLVLAAGITATVEVAPQDNFVVRYQDMGSVSIRFV